MPLVNSATKQKFEGRVNFSLLGKKLGMTQIFNDDGTVVPCTIVQVGPCVVLQKKTVESDGYNAVQLGFDDKKKQRVTKPEAGHAAKAKSAVKRFVKEVRLDKDAVNDYEVGQVLTADLLKVGDHLDVSGMSIGKGYQGVVKRHHFAGFPATRGTHEFRRHGGSIGNREDPGRVFKNRRMAGHMGYEMTTMQNVTVAGIEADKNIVLIRGAVPGKKNNYVVLKASMKGGFEKRKPTKAEAEKTAE